MATGMLLVHGAWVTPLAWERFLDRYRARGLECLAPAWPLMERPVEELRRAPHADLPKLTIRAIVDHYDAIVRARREPPVLVGHSFGGLIVQLLLDRGLGAAGVAIQPLTPRGVPPAPATIRTTLPIALRWKGWDRLTMPSFERFATRFAQLLPEAEKRAVYERQMVPCPGRIFYQAAVGHQMGVDYRNPRRAPLLMIAGDRDLVIPRSMVEAGYRRHRRSPARTDYRLFAGRDHWMPGSEGWEEVADFAVEWAASVT